MFRTNSIAVAAVLAASAANAQTLRVIASATDADFDVPTTQTVTRSITFDTASQFASGIGLSARFTLVQGDTANGTGPWSLDVALTATNPIGDTGQRYNPIGGDITIADFPLADGGRIFDFPREADGQWSLAFSSVDQRSSWTYGLRDVTYYLLTDAGPGQTFQRTTTPDAAQQWNRPFFIEGVSSGGPVAYDAFEFTVSESGVYEFTSVRPDGDDHFTALYRGAFVAQLPLIGLLDYGLGNGFDRFDAPRGTSEFTALLLEGETYIWVTSQWDRFSPIATSDNTITGPGAVLTGPTPCSPVDYAEPFGELDISDVVAFLTAFGATDPAADLAAPEGDFDISDVVEFLRLFGAGCP